jgi:hypothetical protein
MRVAQSVFVKKAEIAKVPIQELFEDRLRLVRVGEKVVPPSVGCGRKV